MKGFVLSTAAVMACAAVTLSAGPAATISGTYVEARTSEIFAGACVVNAEAGTTGREALLAWKVGKGRFNGVALDGLAVVAAVAGDSNLSVHEIGGTIAQTRSALIVDSRATPSQQKALVALVKTLAKDVIGEVVETRTDKIAFEDGTHAIRVSTATDAVRLIVDKHMEHDVTCGNKQWFGPLSSVAEADMGATVENAFYGTSLGTKWSDPNKRSSFYGTFAR
jgi:hypothetical protein